MISVNPPPPSHSHMPSDEAVHPSAADSDAELPSHVAISGMTMYLGCH